VVPKDGFADTISVAIDGLPPGLGVQPGGALQIAVGQTAYVVFRLAASLAAGDIPLVVRGRSGSLSNNQTLTIMARAAGSLPSASTYVRVDETPRLEHGYRGIAYHRSTGLAFAANDGLGTVDVISVSQGKLVKRIPAPGCLSVRIAPDGSQVVVGGSTDYVLVIDPLRLEIVARRRFPPLATAGTGHQLTKPVDVVPMADGTWFVEARQRGTTAVGLVQWDPVTGATVDRTPPTPVLAEVDGLEPSPDGLRLVVFAGVSTGDVAMYDLATGAVVRSQQLGNINWRAAWRPDGQHVAVQTGCCEIVVFDRNLAEVTRLPGPVEGFVYEGTGRSLVLSVPTDMPALQAWDANTYQSAGLIPAIPLHTSPLDLGTPLASDERGVVLVAQDRGVALIDASQPLPPGRTGFLVFGATPDNGSQSAATSASLLGRDVVLPSAVWFGTEPATIVGVSTSISGPQVDVVAPPSAQGGPVNVTVSTPDGWQAILPDGFSYGPTILGVDPPGGPPGGAPLRVLGYGFDYSPSQVRVTVGGMPASIQAIGPDPNANALMRRQVILVMAPSGTPGLTDVGVTTPAGSAVLRNAYRYAGSETLVPLAAAAYQLVYDPMRERVYASEPAAGKVEVVDLASSTVTGSFTAATTPAGIALAQDGSSLAIAGYGDAALFLVDPDGKLPARRIDVLDPTDTRDDPRPIAVAQAGGRVFVGMSRAGFACYQNQVRQVDLASGAVTSRQVGACATEEPFLAASPNGDRVGAVFGNTSDGPYVELSPTTDAYRYVLTGWFLAGVTLAATSAVTDLYVLDADLGIRTVLDGGGLALLHTSGSLLYAMSIAGPAIYDAHTGKLRWTMPLQDPPFTAGFAVDSQGRRIFAATQGGLTIVDLGVAPLGIGDVQPQQAAAGQVVTIQGSGFLPGTLVQIGHQPAAVTFLDPNTLQAVVPVGVEGPAALSVENAGTEAYELPAAITVTP
jgi:hypothetical protein